MPNHVKNIVSFSGSIEEVDYIVNLITKIEETEEGKERRVDFNTLIPMPESLKVVSGSVSDECLKLYISDVFCNDDIYNTNFKKHLKVLQKYDESRIFCKICLRPTELYSLSQITNRCLKLVEKYRADREEKPYDDGPWFRTTADVIAYGEQIYNNIEKYNAKDWYDWCSSDKGWSTKWNAYSNEIHYFTPKHGCKRVDLVFQTAWNIPLHFYEELYKVIHDEGLLLSCNIKFANEDPGSGMGEISDIKNGKILMNQITPEFNDESDDYDEQSMEFYNSVWDY